MLRRIKANLKAKIAVVLKNDRAALKNNKNRKKHPQNASNGQFDNVISITPFLKRDAGCGDEWA